MSLKYSGEGASPSDSWSSTVCPFLVAISFATVIPLLLLFRGSSLHDRLRDLWDLLGLASTHPPGSSTAIQSNEEDSSSTNLQSEVSPPQRACKYDVFLSFRGPDARNTLAHDLYKKLNEKGMFVFKDDKTLETGEPFSDRIRKAVKDSRAAIVVFSPLYPTSFWCLEEMSDIADLHRKSQQIVLPVFYHISSEQVRNQTMEPYKAHFDSLRSKYANDPGIVDRWKSDMTYLGYFGYEKDGPTHSHTVRDHCPESVEIEEITKYVIDKLGYKFTCIANHLIGMQPRIEELERLIKLESEDDKSPILGIWGMGGIGKTTHAKVLFNRLAYQFDASCFIEDISKFYEQDGGGATELLRKILEAALKDQNLKKYNTDRIYRTVQNRLCKENLPRKVLIVLDNVEEQCQWDELTIRPSSLGRESRVIMTTRNQDTLEKIADYRYEVPLLNDDDARQLFSRTVRSDISNSFTDILEYAQGLPLAIEKLGSFFGSYDEKYWEDVLENMRKFPEKKVMNVLQRSYDELRPNEQQIFLHIACFFGGKREKYVKHILDNCGILGHGHGHALQRITKKSLIIIRNEEIHMHKMLQELGKDLVRRNYPDKPELWSRLWHHDDFEKALMSKKETNNVEAIVLDQEEDVSKFCHLMEGLSKWSDLKLFILHHKKCSMSNLDLLLNQLQYNLVELNLPSSIQELWKGEQETNNVEAIVFIRKRMSPNSVT